MYYRLLLSFFTLLFLIESLSPFYFYFFMWEMYLFAAKFFFSSCHLSNTGVTIEMNSGQRPIILLACPMKATSVAYISVVLKAAFTSGYLFPADIFTCIVLELRIAVSCTIDEYSHSFEGDTINLNDAKMNLILS